MVSRKEGKMDIGFGFVSGQNKITKLRVQSWLHIHEDINWNAFVWFLTRYINVIDYELDSVTVEIFTEKERQWLYRKICEYNDELESHNYMIDKGNDLYKTHHLRYKNNKKVIDRLVK